MHAKVFERESKRNNEHTAAVLCQKHDFVHLHHFFFFFVFYLETLIHFGSSFYYCNWLKNSHLNAYSMHHANLEWLIFLTTTLITGTTLIKNDSSIPPLRLFRATRLFVREEHLPVKFAFFF